MSIATYIQNLRDRKDISYMQLAKEIGITYSNIMDLKNDRISFASIKLLDKLAKYEGKTPEEILFDVWTQDEVDADAISLHYMCGKYVRDSYSIVLDPTFPSPFQTGRCYFNGLLQKKRYTSTYVLVDSWQSLRREHWRIYERTLKIPYTRDSFVDVFANEHYYIQSVISYAMAKATAVSKENPGIKSYHILFKPNEDFELYGAKDFIPNSTGLKFDLITVNVPKKL